jgi:hypothetical protein
VLGRICTLIGEQKANISDLRFTDRKPDFYRLMIDVDLRDVEHLHMVMTALEAETDVAQVSASPRCRESPDRGARPGRCPEGKERRWYSSGGIRLGWGAWLREQVYPRAGFQGGRRAM